MNTQIKEVFKKSEGRYFNELEAAQLESYAGALVTGLESMQAIERAEKVIIDEVARVVMERFTALPKDHGADVELRVRRDQTAVLRYATFAMLLHDPNFIYDKFAVWFRTILLSFVKPEQALTGLRALVDACKKHLSPVDADAVTPFIQVVITEFESHGGQPS